MMDAQGAYDAIGEIYNSTFSPELIRDSLDKVVEALTGEKRGSKPFFIPGGYYIRKGSGQVYLCGFYHSACQLNREYFLVNVNNGGLWREPTTLKFLEKSKDKFDRVNISING